jgi:hypothetical protein
LIIKINLNSWLSNNLEEELRVKQLDIGLGNVNLSRRLGDYSFGGDALLELVCLSFFLSN